jgi:uncharacterized protein (TIGR02246 family)
MKQTRLCWNDEVARLKREHSTASQWAEATPGLLHYFAVMEEAGNTVFGPGTHWREMRDAPLSSLHPEVAVQQLISESMQAFAAGDMKRHVSYFTPSAIFVTPSGECLRGTGAILRAFQAERAAMPAMELTPVSTEIVHPATDTALVLMKGFIHHSGMHHPEPWTSTQVVVSTLTEEWKIASLQVYHPR